MESTDGNMDGSLQKEISRREAFERKNAELEGINDELRVENGELRTQAQMLRKKLEEVTSKLRRGSISSSSNSPEVQKKQLKDTKSKQGQKKQSSTPVHSSSDGQDTEVHTLRREKLALKDELEETKAKQLSYEAAFQTEFDLRTTIEEKYDSLRERYERLVIENDELRKLLRQHNILLPSPPSLRPKSRTISNGPLKPPRMRKKVVGSLHSEGRPKSESVIAGPSSSFSQDYLTQGPQSASSELLTLSPHQNVTSPTEQKQFLLPAQLNTIHGSCEITEKQEGSKEDRNSKEEKKSSENIDDSDGTQHKTLDQTNGQPLLPTKTPTGQARSVTSNSTKLRNSTSPDRDGKKSPDRVASPQTTVVVTTSSNIDDSRNTISCQASNFQGSTGVTITLSTDSDTVVCNQSTEQSSKKLVKDKTGLQKDRVNNIETSDLNSKPVQVEKELDSTSGQEKNTDDSDAWLQNLQSPESLQELDSLMESSAQQLKSAKAFYAQMHAHLKKKQGSDDDSDDDP